MSHEHPSAVVRPDDLVAGLHVTVLNPSTPFSGHLLRVHHTFPPYCACVMLALDARTPTAATILDLRRHTVIRVLPETVLALQSLNLLLEDPSASASFPSILHPLPAPLDGEEPGSADGVSPHHPPVPHR